jgi:hypothetical protein
MRGQFMRLKKIYLVITKLALEEILMGVLQAKRK